MIISHKYKFIFIKTRKTAGTSIETYLSPLCEEDDIFTSVGKEKATKKHTERNYKGLFNPFSGANDIDTVFENIIQLGAQYIAPYKVARHHAKFYNHIPAILVRTRVPKKVWKNYYKFCIERDYLDKSVSHYHHLKKRCNRYYNRELSVQDYIDNNEFCLNYPQYTDTNGNVVVNYIGKYENLNDELSFIFDELGIPFSGSLNVYAKSKKRKDRRPPEEFFTGEQKQVLKDAYEKEIKILENWRKNNVR